MRALVQLSEPLIELHPGNPSLTTGGDVGEVEGREKKSGRGGGRRGNMIHSRI